DCSLFYARLIGKKTISRIKNGFQKFIKYTKKAAYLPTCICFVRQGIYLIFFTKVATFYCLNH
ncbi:MAG TPA: hypothetical protein DCS93_01210, partial [Microscillaceae bacterium]|nr:hypothetical protein [Microscillaceae bacterium]